MNSDEIENILKNISLSEYEKVFGYKILYCDTDKSPELYSPLYNVYWENGELEADAPPDTESINNNVLFMNGLYHGIHFTKRFDHYALNEYISHAHLVTKMSFLVCCELSGDIVETEAGYRSQYARIIKLREVSMQFLPSNPYYISERRKNYGNWKRYSEVYSETTKKWREDNDNPTYYYTVKERR